MRTGGGRKKLAAIPAPPKERKEAALEKKKEQCFNFEYCWTKGGIKGDVVRRKSPALFAK